MHLGLSNGLYLYIVTILFLRDCRWTWPAVLHGLVGHHGMYGCQEYCGLKGRHKPGGPHYYPALLKPLDYNLPGCDHGDVDVYRLPQVSAELYFKNLHQLIPCVTDAEFKLVCKETGLCKPSLLVGLDLR